MPSQVVIECCDAIKSRELTIAFAESATAGRMSAEFCMSPASGQILKGGLVCYDATLKVDILKIPKSFIEEHTPESAEVTEELARRLGGLIPSDIQVGVTGLTTPGGSESETKPVGSIFLHICMPGKSIPVFRVFEGEPEQIVLQAIDLAAQTILEELK
ncbi:CinA family protein [Dyadobacter sandarakinus]|uniref:Nicotinamide-nucleotide amidohydrolase family protein n=1 Tax=Dyadobacter sandarakinus TaxID=2747268 RepID=A0ABX7I357_9BACT|nr:nicotinamide-nucleotide amidohydrolase family protein [Dyadobacter sandarakinus]QRR00323.1 nicotinamide-nucleotide amidohydrolase family protein [Dyadobacter sandarakinus]